MKPLHSVTDVRLVAEVNCCPDFNPKREFPNYFRLFKNKDELVEDNSFYSPFFAQGDIVAMNENYGDRRNAMITIEQAVRDKVCAVVRLAYDFTFAAVESYYTNGEFEYVLRLVEKATEWTDLSIIFAVSHFNQLAGNPLVMKNEHFHILLGNKRELNSDELQKAVRLFEVKLTSL